VRFRAPEISLTEYSGVFPGALSLAGSRSITRLS
jgi:hypothetical protein